MTTKNAIISLIKKRNEGYGSTSVKWNYEVSKSSWSNYEVINVKCFEVSKVFSGMSMLIEPMVAGIEIVNDREVNLRISR